MKIGIIGTGAYGLALALTAHENRCQITMYTKFEEEKNELETTHMNNKVLPNILLPKEIKFTNSLEEVTNEKELIIIAIPAEFVSNICFELKDFIKKDQHICIATKGIENETCLFINEIIEKHIKSNNISVISGPSFAIDIASKNPICLTIASKNIDESLTVKKALENKYFKLIYSNDIVGTEICGAIKNVMAIASGIIDGMKATESTKALFITKSLHEIEEIIYNLKADKKTILTFAGIGDLILTCCSTKSRNFSFGKLIGENNNKEDIDIYIKNNTIEGLYTLKSIHKLLNEKKIENNLINLIYDIVFNNKDKKELLNYLTK